MYINVLNILVLTLPGTPTTYYGEEIGMLDIPIPSYEDTQDPSGKKLGPVGSALITLTVGIVIKTPHCLITKICAYLSQAIVSDYLHKHV